METCPVCSHRARADIEQALVASSGAGLEGISAKFGVSVQALKQHMLFHPPLGGHEESLSRRIKLEEANLLSQINQEYMDTLKILGREFAGYVDPTDPTKLSKCISKATADLYLGLGDGIRRNVQTLADLDQRINGSEDTAVTGLKALAQAIRGSND